MFSKKNKKMFLEYDYEIIKSCLFGFFVGDALGVPIEFVDRVFLKKNKITDMKEYGTHYQPKGTWSDDTSMVLATIDGLLKSEKNNIDYKAIMNNFLRWKTNGNFTPFNNVFDIGVSTSAALSRYSQHILNNQPENVICGSKEINSNGNGALMRIIPIALYLYYLGIDYKSKEFMDIIKTISSMTHSHIYSIFGCYIYSIYIIEILKENDKNKAYKNLQKNLQSICKEHPEYEEAKETYKRIIYDDISKLKENDIKSSGYVVDSLEASIWSVLTSKSYKQAVLKAVNLGNDTDTIGALTGGLAGIIYGYKSIPKKWINSLQKKDYLYGIVSIFTLYLKRVKYIGKEKNEETRNKIENEEKDINNKLDIKLLEDTIYDLRNNPKACTIYGGYSNDKILIMPDTEIGEQLSKFIKYFYENKFMDYNYLKNYEKIVNKEIEELTYKEVLTALSKIIRQERFVWGNIYSNVKNGTMLRLIERLYGLVKEKEK